MQNTNAGGDDVQLVDNDKHPYPTDLNKQLATPPIVVAQAVPVNDIQHTEVQILTPVVKCQDMPFAIAFVVHLLVVAGTGFALGVPAVNELAINSTDTSSAPSNSTNLDRPLAAPLFTAAFTSIALSGLALYFIQKYPLQILKCMLLTEAGLVGVLALVSFAAGYVLLGVIYLLFTCGLLCYYWAVRRRLRFTATLLEIAISATNQHKGLYAVAFASPVVQGIWYIVWILSIFGVLKSSSNNYFVALIWVFFFYWAAEAIRNISHTTTSGTIGAWWYSTRPAAPVKNSLSRALTTSLGSIALGSAIVAALQTVRFVLRSLERQARRSGNDVLRILLCCIECIVRQIEYWIRYFNTYSYIMVSLYGSSFMASSREVHNLFQHRGWSAIINDDLVGTVTFITSLTVGCLTGLIGAGVAATGTGEVAWISAVAVFCFLIGLFAAITILDVVTVAVKTLFVCYAKAPYVLSTTHHEQFAKLNSVWRQYYPDVYNSSGYYALDGQTPSGSQIPVATAHPVTSV